MTPEQLIAEGRKLELPCVFLRPTGTGPVAAIWYERDDEEIGETGEHCWITVDARQIPGLPTPMTGFLSVFTDEEECEGGRIEVTSSWPKKKGTELYAQAVSVLPPFQVVFARGSEAVGEWLRANGWDREWAYNSNFKDKAVTDPYWDVVTQEFPLYFDSDVYAVLGGAHTPIQDPDLLEKHLMVLTLRDAEPFVEVWRTKAGKVEVIQQIT